MALFNWTDLIKDSTESKLSTNTNYGFDIVHVQGAGDISLVATKGLSDYLQAAEGQYQDYQRVELYFSLPSYIRAEEALWPNEWLSRIAQIPKKNDTWFGPGDTIPAGNPPKAIAPNLPADHFILAEPFDLAEQLVHDEVKFLAVIPIFPPELEYKMRNSGTALIMRLRKKGFSERIDTYRTSVCRKRFLGF